MISGTRAVAEPVAEGNEWAGGLAGRAGNPGLPKQPVVGGGDPSASAAACLLFLCAGQGLRTSRGEILHHLTEEKTLDLNAAARCGARAGLALEVKALSPEDWRHLSAPVLVQRGDGRFALVAGADDDNVYLIDPRSGNARATRRAAFVEDCGSVAAVPANTTDGRGPGLHGAVHRRSSAEQQSPLRAVGGGVLLRQPPGLHLPLRLPHHHRQGHIQPRRRHPRRDHRGSAVLSGLRGRPSRCPPQSPAPRGAGHGPHVAVEAHPPLPGASRVLLPPEHRGRDPFPHRRAPAPAPVPHQRRGVRVRGRLLRAGVPGVDAELQSSPCP